MAAMEEESTEASSLSCTLPNVLTIFKEADLSCNHRVLGSQLGLSTSHLDEIELSFPYHQRMIQILEKVADIRRLSWPLLASVLRKPALKEISAATYIECHCGVIRCSTASDSSSTLGPVPSASACSPAASLVHIGKNLLTFITSTMSLMIMTIESDISSRPSMSSDSMISLLIEWLI